MYIDFVLGSLELPSDQPHWEQALLAKLSDVPGAGDGPVAKSSLAEDRPHSGLILPFARVAAV